IRKIFPEHYGRVSNLLSDSGPERRSLRLRGSGRLRLRAPICCSRAFNERVARFQGIGRTKLYVAQKFADVRFILWYDALEQKPICARAARNQHLFVQGRRSGGDMRLGLNLLQQRTPITDAISSRALEANMRRGSKKSTL